MNKIPRQFTYNWVRTNQKSRQTARAGPVPYCVDGKETDKSWQGLTLFTIASMTRKLIDLQAIKSYRSMSECRECELPEGPRLAESENKAPAFMK